MRRTASVLLALGAVSAASAATAAVPAMAAAARPATARPAAAHAAAAHAVPARPSACSTNWGTGAKHGGPNATVPTAVLAVRAGRHACFDRLVIVLGRGPRPPFSAQYVAQIIQDGSGRPLPVRGHARILIVVRGPAGPGYHPNAVNLVNVSGFVTFRQVRGAGSFERVTSIGLGVRAKLPFRAFVIGSPSLGWRLIIDVAH